MNYLKFCRMLKKMTQKELAKKTGVDQGTISRAETGYALLYPKQAKALAKFLGCKEEDLLREVDASWIR